MAPARRGNDVVVSLNGVWAAYSSGSHAICDVSLDVGKGSNYALVGPSGSGKSTTLRLINGMMVASRGRVLVEGLKPDTRDAAFRRVMPHIGYIPQSLGLVKNSSVRDNVAMGGLCRVGRFASLLKRYSGPFLEEIREALGQVGLEGKEDRPAYALSGGEKRRVAIARALMQKPRILLADEIVSELDAATAADIMKLVADIQKKTGMTAVMIHHDIRLALEFADRVGVIQEGRKVMELGVDKDTILDFQSGTASREEIMEMYGGPQE